MSTADMLGPRDGFERRGEAVEGDASESGAGSSDEEGIDLMGDETGDDDSSDEEEEDDPEELARIREGFIVDEDEEERKRRKARRKEKRRRRREREAAAAAAGDAGSAAEGDGGEKKRKKKRRHSDAGSEEEDLDEEDLALVLENTGLRISGRGAGSQKKRLRRAGAAASESDEERGGLKDIFADDDEDRGMLDDMNDDEMAGFIEDDVSEDEEDRRMRKDRERQRKRGKKSSGLGRRLEGISQEVWSEVTEVFGNGQDYAWALEEESDDEKAPKQIKDVFDPSAIASRMLTAEDDVIRAIDIPERFQIASASLPKPEIGENGPMPYLEEHELEEAAEWMSTRISSRIKEEYLVRDSNGNFLPLREQFMTALQKVIYFINVEFLEVPLIWNHRSDYIVHYDPEAADLEKRSFSFLHPTELWKIQSLSIQYRALLARKNALRHSFSQLEVQDEYFDEVFISLESSEEVSDLSEWVSMRYSSKMADLKLANGQSEESLKRATRLSSYDVAKKTVVSQLAEDAAISSTDLALNFIAQSRVHSKPDPTQAPLELAEQFAGENYPSAESALSAARSILVHEIGKDPTLRREARRFYRDYGVVSVTPTEKGQGKIDELHPYWAFKYLLNKPVNRMLRSTQFLQIIAAEEEGLVKSSIMLPETAYSRYLSDLTRLYISDEVSSVSEQWNDLRKEVLQTAVSQSLFPQAERWARTYLKEEEEEHLGRSCADTLQQRIDRAPFCRRDVTQQFGEMPSVLAVSNGQGDPRRDRVVAVFIDSDGHYREMLEVDTLFPDRSGAESDGRKEFEEFVRRRRPQVVVVGGFSPNARQLYEQILMINENVAQRIHDSGDDVDGRQEYMEPEERRARSRIFTTWTYDDVARVYQNSLRAQEEFADLPKLAKYCVGLARYVQSPLNEYAALGSDLTAVTYDVNQKLLSQEKLMSYLECALVEITNKVGVDINRAVRESYYGHLLQYVGGLGPRKASAITKRVHALGGAILSRSDLVTKDVMANHVFINASAFLRILQDEMAEALGRDDDEQQDILDDTRIHPEDYDVARKMAADAMEIDEEDIQHPSFAVSELLANDVGKLDDLSLDDFATELQKLLGQPKRITLYAIRNELRDSFAEKREEWARPTPDEVFEMLTGETRETLEPGLIVPVKVIRYRPDSAISVRLDCGLVGSIAASFRTDRQDVENVPKPPIGSTIRAVVTELNRDQFEVEFSTQEQLLENGDFDRRRVQADLYYDTSRATSERQDQVASQLKKSRRNHRIINHPAFHNFNAGEAEQYLANMQRGDCVIRPSSREDHLAVTWKVDDGIYQHIAVHELNKPSENALGTSFRIEGFKTTYEDLDELIDQHVKQMARKVNELVNHNRYRPTSKALDEYLFQYVQANPDKSAYGFTLHRDPARAGQFSIAFRANVNAGVQSWSVTIGPGSYILFNQEHGDMTSLINGFKMLYSSASGGKPPGRVSTYGGSSIRQPGIGSRTPMYNPGGRTPLNPMMARPGGSVRYAPSPNPYAGGRTPLPGAAGQQGHASGSGSAYASGRTPLHRPGGMTPAYQSRFG